MLNSLFQSLEVPPSCEGAVKAVPYIAGICVLGAGLYFSAQYFKKPNKTQLLIKAIKDKAENLAQRYISEMSNEELNQADPQAGTPLYCALDISGKLSKLIVNKFLAAKQPLNTVMPNGKSIFSHNKLGKRLLSTVNSRYKTYACSDAKRFPGNIHAKADRNEILSRKEKNIQAAAQSTTIQPLHGKYTRENIAQCAKLVDIAQAGACTTFACAVADKLLTLFPNERFEIIAYKGGWKGSHVYVVMNHQGEGWKLNTLREADNAGKLDLKNVHKQIFDEALDELEGAYVIDPWLASLGWDSGVFDLFSYAVDPTNGHFIFDTECYYDSKPLAALNKTARLT